MDLWKAPDLPPDLAAKYADEAGHFWDLFYRRNKEKFFKDRHYFAAEFPQLLTAGSVLEVGCGVGNSLFPLLELNPRATLYACDFAPSAVDLVKAHPLYRQHAPGGRVTAFVADITADDLTATVPPASMDIVTMIFVLSAVAPEAMAAAVQAAAATLRPGGLLLFRDYAVGDLAQGRLGGEGRQQRLAGNCYVRWDGTLAYYFTEGSLRELFEAHGFRCDELRPADKLFVNRKTGERMDRRFVQAVFTYLGPPGAGAGMHDGKRKDAVNSSCQPGGQDQQLEEQQLQQLDAPSQRQQQPSPAQGVRGHAAQQPQQAEQGQDAELVAVQLGGVRLHVRCRQRYGTSADRAAAEMLAAAVLRCPTLFMNADVLELCTWHAPLGALGALRWARRAVAASQSRAELASLRANALRNGHLFVIERLRVACLSWRQAGREPAAAACTSASSEGCEEGLEDGTAAWEEEGGHRQQQAQPPAWQQETWQEQREHVRRAFPHGFHAVLAALPTAADGEELRDLLACAGALLSRRPASVVLLACAEAQADGQALAEAAAAAGLCRAGLPTPLAEAAPASQPCLLCLQHIS